MTKSIAGASVILAPDFNDEQNPRIEYEVKGHLDSLRANLTKPDGTVIISREIVIPEVPGFSGGDFTFELTEAERVLLRKYCNDANSKQIRFQLVAKAQGQYLYSGTNRVLTIINAMPSMNPTVEDVNPTTLAVTKNRRALVKYVSIAKCNMNAVVRKEATIAEATIRNAQTLIEGTEHIADGVESNTFYLTLIDSRGNMVNKILVIQNFYEYFRPSISIKKAEMDSVGKMTFEFGGKFFNDKINEELNHIQVFYSLDNGNFMPIDLSNVQFSPESYSVNYSLSGLDYTHTYSLNVKIVDLFSQRISEIWRVVAIPVFDWGKDDFNFNVPVIFSKGFNIKDGDAVIEFKKDGIWNVRKWQSGIAECWCEYKQSGININQNAISGIVYSPATVKTQLPADLFKSQPVCIASFQGLSKGSTTYAAFDYVKAKATKTETSGHSFYRIGSAQTNLTANYDFYCIGRWK